MQIRKDGEIIYNSIDNTGSTDDAAMGARTTKGRLDTLDGRFAGYYTKAEVLELLTGVAATLIVAELPEEPEANTYYLVGNDGDGYVLHYYDTELEHAIVGSYELDLSSVSPQRATMPTAAAALENKCYQYVGTGDVYEFGVWYRCENVAWYAWLNSANANTYFTESATPDVNAAIYNTAKERMPAKVVTATETTMTDTTNTSYTRNAVADTSEYMWVPLHTKLSQFVNDGDGTNADGDKFITRVSADARYVQPSTEATLTNKIIDADLNTIADLTTANLKSGVLQTSIGSGSTDTQLPTAKSVYGYAVPKTNDALKVYGTNSSNAQFNYSLLTSITSSAADTQIPSGRAVYNFAVPQTATGNRIYGTNSSGGETQYPFSDTYTSSADGQLATRKAVYNLYNTYCAVGDSSVTMASGWGGSITWARSGKVVTMYGNMNRTGSKITSWQWTTVITGTLPTAIRPKILSICAAFSDYTANITEVGRAYINNEIQITPAGLIQLNPRNSIGIQTGDFLYWSITYIVA